MTLLDNRNNIKSYTVDFYLKIAIAMTLGMMKQDKPELDEAAPTIHFVSAIGDSLLCRAA
jgi:hypothetical protein